jgi:Kef-type K+ transport system membrane component KefB
MLAALFLDTPAAHGDPVVPILLALVFFTLGAVIGVIDDGLFSATVILVMITTFLAPVLLRFSLGPEPFSPTQSARRA